MQRIQYDRTGRDHNVLLVSHCACDISVELTWIDDRDARVLPRRGALPQKSGVSDPLPPSAALPLSRGRIRTGPYCPPREGDSASGGVAASAGGRSHRTFEAKPPRAHIELRNVYRDRCHDIYGLAIEQHRTVNPLLDGVDGRLC